jgi:hypothetical protein
MRRTITWHALFVAFLTTSCILPIISVTLPTPTPEVFTMPTSEVIKTKLPALDGLWSIKMKHSGGIMGLLRTIEISSDGSFTVVDERANKTAEKKLSSVEVSKLEELVSTSEYISPNMPEAICADCFIYDLEIQGSGKKFNIQLNDLGLADSGLESLVDYLRNLIDTSLK